MAKASDLLEADKFLVEAQETIDKVKNEFESGAWTSSQKRTLFSLIKAVMQGQNCLVKLLAAHENEAGQT